MANLVECVPNFSEGRRGDVIDALADTVSRTPGVHLLDRTSDRDHNRSVLTFAGPPSAVTAAMESAVETAIALIDMAQHEGQHPRIGAVDVIPFVPLGRNDARRLRRAGARLRPADRAAVRAARVPVCQGGAAS